MFKLVLNMASSNSCFIEGLFLKSAFSTESYKTS